MPNLCPIDSQNHEPCAERRGPDPSGSLQGAGRIGGLLARTDGNGQSPYYSADANGNITAMVDGNGKVVARYEYDPYGNPLGMWGSLATVNHYRFSSKEIEPLTGDYYFSYRYYNPNWQRWLNRDPLGEPGFEVMQRSAPYRTHSFVQGPAERTEGPNLYEYVHNSPVQYVDPLGLQVPPQVIEALESPEAQEMEEAIAADAEAAAQASEAEMQSLMQKARELYPKLCNKFQGHHITPKYLGGDPNGPLVLLEGPYHQLITNAFRNQWACGQGVPPSTTVVNIVNTVYSQFPLPK